MNYLTANCGVSESQTNDGNRQNLPISRMLCIGVVHFLDLNEIPGYFALIETEPSCRGRNDFRDKINIPRLHRS